MDEKLIETEPYKMGKILIELDIDKDVYNIAFSNLETAALLKQVEMNNLFSPFHAACIINELKRRKDKGLIEKATPNIILQIHNDSKRKR